MYLPPIDPRDPSPRASETWRTVLLSYVAIGAIPVALLSLSRPLAAVGLVAAAALLAVLTGRALALGRCYYDCGGFSVDLGDRVQVCVTQSRVEC